VIQIEADLPLGAAARQFTEDLVRRPMRLAMAP